MNTQSELHCHIIPVEAGSLLVPELLVADVVMLEDTDNQQDLVWKSRSVPILQGSQHNKTITRVVILKTTMGYKNLPFIAIATDGIPHSLVVNPALLSEPSVENKTCDIAASYVTVGSLECIVPDLPKVEREMQEKLS